jgi:hypothetical protein
MEKSSGFGTIVAVVGSVLILNPSIAKAQIAGAVQYPPLSVGADAQPPPPARMAPQTVSPRQIELGVSGSSQMPADYGFQFSLRPGADRFTLPGVVPPRPAAAPPSTAGGD